MAAIELTFTVLSIIILLYIGFWLAYRKKLPLVVELLYVGVYLISAIFFFFPASWYWLNRVFGVQLALDLIIVIAVFLLFAACVRLYQKLEKARQDITQLARELSLARAKK